MSFLIASVHVAVFAAATTKKTTSSGSSTLIFILVIIALGAYLWMRPQRRRMRAQQTTQRDIEVGDEVVTASGIIGHVQAFVGNRVELEIAPGTTIEVLRQAVARRAEPNVVESDEHEDNEHDLDEDASDGGSS